jgi:protein-S-isoprenylcysteine O-methyltransferase Ste14
VNRLPNWGITNNIPLAALFAVLVAFIILLSSGHIIFPNSWFPSQLAASAFEILFCTWILCEFANNVLSKRNSIAANQDKGSFRLIIVVSWVTIFAISIFRSLGIGIFSGFMQFSGLIIFAAGIVLREWAIFSLGKHFNVRVQVRKEAKLVTWSPYRYIRHPSYTGTLLSITG